MFDEHSTAVVAGSDKHESDRAKETSDKEVTTSEYTLRPIS